MSLLWGPAPNPRKKKKEFPSGFAFSWLFFFIIPARDWRWNRCFRIQRGLQLHKDIDEIVDPDEITILVVAHLPG